MSSILLHDICRKYETAKLMFLKSLLDLTNKKQNFENFEECNIFNLVKPFLNDSSKNVQNAASLFLVRSAEQGNDIAPNVLNAGIIPHLLNNIWSKEHAYQVNTLKALQALGSHSEASARALLDAGALQHLENVFSVYDKVLLAHAVYAAGKLGAYPETAIRFADSLHLFHTLLHRTDVTFLKSLVAALGDIAFSSEETTEKMANGIIQRVANLLTTTDIPLKETVLATIARFASHSPQLAIEVVNTKMFPKILECLGNSEEYLKKNAIDAIIQITKHNEETAGIFVKEEGIPAFKIAIHETSKIDRQKCIELFGLIAQYPQIAHKLNDNKVIQLLMTLLREEKDYDMIMSIIWTLGELAKDSHTIASAVANENVLPILIRYLTKPNEFRCYSILMNTFTHIYQNCVDERMIGIFLTHDLQHLPQQLVEHALANLSVYLPLSPRARIKFLESGALERMMCFNIINTERFRTYKIKIMRCYPANIIRDMQIRMSREMGIPWEEMVPVSQGTENIKKSMSGAVPPRAWLPRPLRAIGCDDVRLPSAEQQKGMEEWLPFPRVRHPIMPRLVVHDVPTAWRVAATASTAFGSASSSISIPTLPETPRVAMPPLTPGGDVGMLPLKVSCTACCELFTPLDEICCREVEDNAQPMMLHKRLCHIIPQGSAVIDRSLKRRSRVDEMADRRLSDVAAKSSAEGDSPVKEPRPLIEILLGSSDDSLHFGKCCSKEELKRLQELISGNSSAESLKSLTANVSGTNLVT